MDDWDVFSFDGVDDDVADFDGRDLVKKQDVAALHRWLHAAGKYHDNWAFGPETKLEHVPYHYSTGND